MQLPETPAFLRDLDLMKRLVAYQNGEATWYENERQLGPKERAACQQLNANLTNFVEKCLHPLMDRVTAREDVLRNWTTFVSDNLVWPIFADFTHPVEDYLCECFSGNFFINKKFESQFEGFELSEIRSATGLFEKLTTARFTGRPAQFSQIEIKLLLRFSDVVGDLTVRRYSKSYTVRELVKGKTPSLETTRAE
jgi:hypothetical protein